MANPNKDLKNLAHAQEETPEELEALKLWWEAHGNLVTIVLVAVLAAVVGARQFRAWRVRRNEAAMDAIAAAATAEQLEEAAVSSKSAAVSALARLRLAGARYAAGEYELALESYEAFLRVSPKHPLAPVARSGTAHALEALGRLEEAADAYEAIGKDPACAPFASDAALGQARTLVLRGTEDSRSRGKAILDLFLAENAGTSWAVSADELLRAIDRLKMPERKDDIEAFLGGESAAPAPDAAAEAPATETATEAPAETPAPDAATEAPAPAPAGPAPETPAS